MIAPTIGQAVELRRQMQLSLAHRGPDGEGSRDFPEADLSIGHTRLSIVDLDGSSQPMSCRCGRYTISFNGEIFNYRDLRQELDYEFATDGDTETLLALWMHEGPQGLQKVRGQFAFLIWDHTAKTLSMAVDAMGVLPLYTVHHGRTLAVSSSASSLAEVFAKAPSPEAIPTLLSRRALAAPATPWSGISRLAPGELWTYGLGKLTRSRWALELESRGSDEKPPTVASTVQLLTQSAKRAITADVEVGIFLSGGIDSAIVAKLASDLLPYRVRAYTAIWDGGGQSNEGQAAARTAEALGLSHTQIKVSAHDWWRALIAGTEFRDAPIAEPADAVFLLLAERARMDVKVVLTGEGADELFAGYPKYRVEALLGFQPLHRMAGLFQRLFAKHPSQKLRRLLSAAAESNARSRFERYFGSQVDISTTAGRLHPELSPAGGMRSLRLWDLTQYLPSVLLDRADRMAMAHSLEVRPVFLDSDVVDFALGLESRHLLSVLGTKRLLRKAARKLLPRQLTHTRKRGFPLPLAEWLRTELTDATRTVLAAHSELLDPFIAAEDRVALLEEHCSRTRDNTLALFSLTSVLLWLESRECRTSAG